MSSVKEEIENLRKEAAQKASAADQLEALLTKYPDLKKNSGRWNKVAFSSAHVNSIVDRFDIRHNCGCCNDSPLEIWPYLETPHGKIYSEPAKFVVGEKHWISGDTPYDGWKTSMKVAGIPEGIIAAVQAHFDQSKEDRKAAVED